MEIHLLYFSPPILILRITPKKKILIPEKPIKEKIDF